MSYQDYHKNSINKFIHVICIPLIMTTTINFLSVLKLRITNHKTSSKNIHSYNEYGYDSIIATIFPLYYFIFYSNYIGMIMTIFSYFVYKIGKIWRNNDTNWWKNTIVLFINAWALQFIGHFIEGNRPAFFYGMRMSVFEAPLYTLQSLFTFSVYDNL